MPDVVRCSSCRKETYAGQTRCPHCRLTLVPLAPERPVEAEASSVQPSIQHDQFVSGLRSGVLSLRYDSERLNSESFYHVWPSLYAQQLAVKFLLFPIATVGAIVGLFWADNLAEGGVMSGPAVFVVGYLLVMLIGGGILGYRKLAIKRRMLKDESFYRLMIQKGFVAIADVEAHYIGRQP